MFSPAGPQLVPLLHASSSPDTWKGQICLIQVHVCPPGVNVNMPFTGLQRPGAVGGGGICYWEAAWRATAMQMDFCLRTSQSSGHLDVGCFPKVFEPLRKKRPNGQNKSTSSTEHLWLSWSSLRAPKVVEHSETESDQRNFIWSVLINGGGVKAPC